MKEKLKYAVKDKETGKLFVNSGGQALDYSAQKDAERALNYIVGAVIEEIECLEVE
jgi:hypothetical protein